VAYGPLARDFTTDVLVIGAGITGAAIADGLASIGIKVAVVDKRGLARGSTVASTALVQYEIDTPLITLTRKIGKENAIRAWRRSRLAVEALATRLQQLGFADVARRDSLYLSGNVLGPAELTREHEARRSAGLPSRFLTRKRLSEEYGIPRAAIMSYGNLVIDPRKCTLTLLNAAAANGACIFSPMEITEIRPTKSDVTVTAANGRQIQCTQLVFATGYELPHGVPHHHHRITSTWAVATVPQEATSLWPGECCIWEASKPYLYIRTTPEGRVICGGEDAHFSQDRLRKHLLTSKTRILQRKLHRLLPKLDPTIEFAWTGAFGETTTGLPLIGRVPGMPHCWIALGYGGNGTTYAILAADIIAGEIAGRPDVDADLYRFPAHPRSS
jgi:glycine/D-amino acid oxidase-like deaminating enzyme